MRYLTWLLVLLIFGCTSRPQDQAVDANILPDRQQARNNLKAQAEEVGRAAVEEDHAKMAELTLPALVEKFGGRAAYVKQLQSSAAGIRGQGFRLKKITIGEPSALIQAAGEVYAVVPAELEVNGPKGARGRQPSYLIAVSHDGGVRWKFIDGFGAGGDRGKLTALLPNFPEQLRLPAAQPPVWENQPVPLTRSPGPPKSFARAGFTFDYPPSWTLNDKGKDHDPDHQFTIDASLGAMIMFVIADAKLDPARALCIRV